MLIFAKKISPQKKQSIESLKEINEAFLTVFLAQDKSETLYFFKTENPTLDFVKFSKNFKLVCAAGGVVKNEKGKYLAIKRNGVWDLPKGKIEKNEKIEDAALREVEEECGLENLTLLNLIYTTYHVYPLKNNFALKPTYWFSMNVNNPKRLVPQFEEGITQVKFLNKKQLKDARKSTYLSLKPLFSRVLKENT